MTNVQLYLAVAIPSFMVLLGIVLQQLGQSRIENRLTAVESDLATRIHKAEGQLGSRLTTIEGDLRRFYESLGHHEGTLDIVKKKLDL
jgi:hypothetical protein